MGRIRTIKPSFWEHEQLSALPEPTHLLAAALLNYVDDEGYFNANPALVKAATSPLREPSVSIHGSLNMLAAIEYIKLGTGEDGRRYGHVVNFDTHQRVNRPSASKIKPLKIVWEDSVKFHGSLSEHSRPEREGEREIGKGRESTAAATVPSSAREPAAAAPKDVIREFDESLADLWGVERRRAYPHNTDAVFAQRWLDAGATPALCRATFDALHGRMAAEDQDPPRTLKYHDAAIREALAAKDSPNVVPLRQGGGPVPYRPTVSPHVKQRGELIWEAMTDEEREQWASGDPETKADLKARAAARLDQQQTG